jgi:hypothetical protein
LSTTTRNIEMQRIARIHQRRAWTIGFGWDVIELM